jgi:hypothetical protein
MIFSPRDISIEAYDVVNIFLNQYVTKKHGGNSRRLDPFEFSHISAANLLLSFVQKTPYRICPPVNLRLQQELRNMI